MVTATQLGQIMRNASTRRLQEYAGPLNDAMAAHAITSLPRVAMFLAQLAHESGEFRYLREIWGPTAAQKRYEPPSPLARRLGNTEPGDGKRFMGRGPIQITGRDNYRRYGKLLGIDLETSPELAESAAVGFRIAGVFWQRNGLNALADAGDFTGVTQRINGGQNGAAERLRYYRAAREVLAGTLPAQAAGEPTGRALRSGARTASKAGAAAAAGLARGAEAVREATSAPPPARAGKAGTSAKTAAAKPRKPRPAPARTFDARADTLDFRDLMYTPTLVEVPSHIPLGDYLDHDVPILDQGSEGACTGYGLATVANYLLRRRRVLPDPAAVSARMLYRLARRYDEWPGEKYDGSSARGAMKGWHKHGVCSETRYPSRRTARDGLTDARTADARRRPLGAYFRVNHKDIVAMHSAIAEVGVLYATCVVHRGWDEVGADGLIPQTDQPTGGHAFALVAYDEEGFWLQNSWGRDWGRGGFARISYDDWLENGTDVWVARLGAPVTLRRNPSAAIAHASTSAQSTAYAYADIRPHLVSVGNGGELKAGGDYGSTPAELQEIFEVDMPARLKTWARPRVMLYAHGGLVGESAAVQRVAEYRPALLGKEIYPLAFIWRSDYWTTVTNILQDAVRRRRPEGALDAAKDFMLDRFDDALEPLARSLTGRSCWNEMKENALAASLDDGAAVRVADHLAKLVKKFPGLEIHVVGHSAGSILLAPLLGLLAARSLPVHTCTLWAPACTVDLFEKHYLPALDAGALRKLAIFALADASERDDHCAKIYNKSLLYLVSNAFEKKARIPLFRDGEPILGMEKFLSGRLRARLDASGVDIVLAPNRHPLGSPDASDATTHGAFDDDDKTVAATFERILAATAGSQPVKAARSRRSAAAAGVAGSDVAPVFHRSDSSLREQRRQLDADRYERS